MIHYKEISIQKIKANLQVNKPWDSVIIFALNLLIAIPVFIIIHQNSIDFEFIYHIDRIVLFIVILISIQVVLRLLKTIIIVCVFLYLIALFYGTIFGGYGFIRVYEDYRSLVYSMSENPYPQDIIISRLLPFPNKYKVLNAIEYDHPKVRNFAIMALSKQNSSIEDYHKYRTLIQCFAVFREINTRWNYVNDPKGRDYIAKASESIVYLSGDCDDHAIVMAACVKSIGGEPRLIHTGGHIYPEIQIGNRNDLEAIHYLIKQVLFESESKGKTLYYHIDERGQVWLNLDYTAKYPGGPFMSEEILGALTLTD